MVTTRRSVTGQTSWSRLPMCAGEACQPFSTTTRDEERVSIERTRGLLVVILPGLVRVEVDRPGNAPARPAVDGAIGLDVSIEESQGNATALEEASIYATYGSLLKGKTQVDFFEDPQHIGCTQVPPPSHLQVPLPSHINIQPASIDMQENALNLSQGSGMTYSQMMQNMESMQFSQQGQVSFLDLLTGPMGNENQMFMITGRSEYVHNSDEDYAHGDNACSLNDTRGRNAQPDEYTDDQEDSAYKYNDTWVNPPQSGQNSDNSDGGEQECSQPDIPDNREDPNVASTVDLAGEDSDGEVRSVEEDVVQELSQEDIEIYLENESLKAAQTCSQEVRSHHVPHIDQVFDTHEAAFEFYNTYSDIIGFSAKIAGNYHCRKNNKATRYTFKCNRSGKVLDEETKAERKRKRDLKRQETRRKKMQEKGETEPLKPSPPPGVPPKDQPKKRKRNNVEITASDGSKSNEKYLFVTQEVKKIAEKLDAMTLAEDKAKELDPKDKSNGQVGDVGYAETEYGYLNDPKVVKSKGRPTTSAKQKLDGRYRTFAEQFLWKQQITCSHCGSHYHNIQTCESLHLDSSLFANNKKPKSKPRGNKKSTDESSNKAKKTREK
ncbi:hypothetical protein ACQ4PT_067797 [Festuca glaucescens]